MKNTSLIKEVRNIIDIIYRPSKVFNEINKAPSWLVAYIFITLGTIVIRLLYFPVLKRIFLSYWNPEYSKPLIQTAKSLTILSASFSPFYLILKFLIISIILWLFVQLFAFETNFKKIFSIVVYCGIIAFLGSVLTLLILYLRGLESIKSGADIQVSLGIDLFLKSLNLSLPFKTFLSKINILSIWWIVLMALGISISSKISRTKSTLIAILLWLFSTGIQVGLVSLQTSLLKLG